MEKLTAVTHATAMRPAVIKDYIERHAATWARMTAQIAARDDLFRALNQEFGYKERDGSYRIGKCSSVDPPYVRRYDTIEHDFRVRYEAERPRDLEIDRRTLSIYEYLTLDNAALYAEAHLLAFATERVSEPWADFVKERAVGDVKGIVAKHSTMGRALALIEHQKADFRFRAMRCRRLFGLSALSGATKTIGWFRADYLKHLRAEFDAVEIGQ